jgi:hypothetical protein
VGSVDYLCTTLTKISGGKQVQYTDAEIVYVDEENSDV